MLNSVGERTPLSNASFKLTVYGCVVSVCFVGFVSLVVCDELHDCTWNPVRAGGYLVETLCYGVI